MLVWLFCVGWGGGRGGPALKEKNICWRESFCVFPDDRFWNLGYPTGSPGLAVNWSVGKNWNALVFKEGKTWF